MTKQYEKKISQQLKKTLKEVRNQGLKAGAAGILRAVLEMCNEGKTVDDIKVFCEMSLSIDGMKFEEENEKRL